MSIGGGDEHGKVESETGHQDGTVSTALRASAAVFLTRPPPFWALNWHLGERSHAEMRVHEGLRARFICTQLSLGNAGFQISKRGVLLVFPAGLSRASSVLVYVETL